MMMMIKDSHHLGSLCCTIDNRTHCTTSEMLTSLKDERLKVWALAIVLLTWFRTQEEQHFISKVAADRHELTIPQHIMGPSTAHANGQLEPQCS